MSRSRFPRSSSPTALSVKPALNHTNICTLYDVGPDYLVTELIERPTLADRIQQGPIPLEEALLIAKQIADALEAAHDKGMVHRDLKPANVKIRPDGSVKVLDPAHVGRKGGIAFIAQGRGVNMEIPAKVCEELKR